MCVCVCVSCVVKYICVNKIRIYLHVFRSFNIFISFINWSDIQYKYILSVCGATNDEHIINIMRWYKFLMQIDSHSWKIFVEICTLTSMQTISLEKRKKRRKKTFTCQFIQSLGISLISLDQWSVMIRIWFVEYMCQMYVSCVRSSDSEQFSEWKEPKKVLFTHSNRIFKRIKCAKLSMCQNQTTISNPWVAHDDSRCAVLSGCFFCSEL